MIQSDYHSFSFRGKEQNMFKNFDKIEVLDQNQHPMIAPDVSVTLEEDGKLTVFGGDTKIGYIRLEKTCSLFDQATVLGDAWERGYAEFCWKKADFSRILPWYFAAQRDGKVFCVGVKTQPNAFCAWQCGENKLVLTADVRNGSDGLSLNGRTLEVCTVVSKEYSCTAFSALCDFCKMMCPNPRLPGKPIYGGNDWYCNYGNNTYEKIMMHTRRIMECAPKNGKPYMMIDDGWQLCHHDLGIDEYYFNGGPWKYCNEKFGDMEKLAKEIKQLGAIPGIWFRPLWTVEEVPDEVVLKRDGIKLTLDPSTEYAKNKIFEDVRTICHWGYRMIKHDFSTFDFLGRWGREETLFDRELHFQDKTKTTAEIMKDFYQTLRDAAGDEVLLMGCNTMSHLSAGYFDVQRTGDDTSGKEWERTKDYGVNTLAFRMPQHNRFYFADADCVGITKHVPWEKNRQWLDVLSKSGTAVFVSIAEDCWTEEIKQDIREAFRRAEENLEPSEPIDWMEKAVPEIWKSHYGLDQYQW